jgi:hypothetical protein
MEEYRVNPQSESGIFNIEVDEVAKATLLETARWTKFLAVIGIVVLSLLLLAGISAGAIMSSVDSSYSSMFTAMGTAGMITYCLVVIAIQFYPIYAMMKFSTMVKRALNTADKVQFNEALGYLKGIFKYIGIVTIIVISLYGLIFIFAAIGIAMRS